MMLFRSSLIMICSPVHRRPRAANATLLVTAVEGEATDVRKVENERFITLARCNEFHVTDDGEGEPMNTIEEQLGCLQDMMDTEEITIDEEVRSWADWATCAKNALNVIAICAKDGWTAYTMRFSKVRDFVNDYIQKTRQP